MITDLTPSEVVLRFTDRAPVDLDALASALGVNVVYDRSLSPDISGKIERMGSGRSFQITINAMQSDRRQRFTLAHEIGHFILHRDLIGDGITDDGMYRSALSNQREQEANRFAADLIMPARLVRSFFRDGIRTIDQIANKFEVSAEAASIRMEQLRLR